jgi:hypothetical protein
MTRRPAEVGLKTIFKQQSRFSPADYDMTRRLTEAGLKTILSSKVGLAQLIRFLVVEPNYPVSNHRFDIGVAFTANYFFSGNRRPYQ